MKVKLSRQKVRIIRVGPRKKYFGAQNLISVFSLITAISAPGAWNGERRSSQVTRALC